MDGPDYRRAIAEYIRAEAKPPDKFSHQPRLYHLACKLAEGQPFDDDVLYAAAWLHDIGVFLGHRPEDPAALATWDNVAYAVHKVPELLNQFGFPPAKIPAVAECIRTHLPSRSPGSFEAMLLRDADILEQLGAIGVLRTVCKVGRDTRYPTHGEAVRTLRRNLEELPRQLRLASAHSIATARLSLMNAFLDELSLESGEVEL